MEEQTMYLPWGASLIQCKVFYTEINGDFLVENVYGYIGKDEYNLNTKLLFVAQDILNEKGSDSPV